MTNDFSNRLIDAYKTFTPILEFCGDKRVFSCPIFGDKIDLDDAQRNKYRIFLEQIGLKDGETVLEHASGMGAFGNYIHDYFDVYYTGVNICPEQVEYAQKRYGGDYVVGDCRKIKDTFDVVLSDGAYTHMGTPVEKERYIDIASQQTKRVFLVKELFATGDGSMLKKYCEELNPIFNFTGEYTTCEVIESALNKYFSRVEKHEIPIVHYAMAMTLWGKIIIKIKDKIVGIYGQEYYTKLVVEWQKYIELFWKGGACVYYYIAYK